MPFDVYAADPGVNDSLFEAATTGAHALHYLTHGSTDTPTFRKGRALHVAVLEPGAFEHSVVVRPEFKGDGARKARRDWDEAHADCIILTPGEMEDVEGMAAGIRRNKATRKAAEDGAGHSEATCIWIDRETGVRCKCRLDRYVPGVLMMDVKTTRSAKEDDFADDVFYFNYHRKLAWYRRGVLACGGVETPWTIVAVEAEAPHEAALFTVEPDILKLGDYDAQAAFHKVAGWIRSGEWAGFPEVAQTLYVPERVRRLRRFEIGG